MDGGRQRLTHFGPEHQAMSLEEIALQPTDRIPVILDAQTWETVLRVIAQAPVPYAVVAPLIASIQQQCANHTVADDPQPMVPRVTMKEA
jgi:hypothetical protein